MSQSFLDNRLGVVGFYMNRMERLQICWKSRVCEFDGQSELPSLVTEGCEDPTVLGAAPSVEVAGRVCADFQYSKGCYRLYAA
jgi:hypothetical protein